MRTITSMMALVTLVAILSPLYANAEQVPQPPTKFQQFQINGAGATFPFPLIDLWRVEYNKLYSNVNLNYQSIGSGGGVKQHIEKTVDFAGTDAPLTTSERELAPKTLHIPEAIGGVTVVYNIPEIPNKGLKLTGNDIADIYLGKIKKWNDPKIAQNNPDVALPNADIVPVRRSDGSGTTFVFTDYLSTVSSEFEKTVGKGKSVQWQVGLGAAGNEGVAGTVRSTTYSIGYVELAYAFQTGMSFSFVQNGVPIRTFHYADCRITDYKVTTDYDKEEGWFGKGFATLDTFTFICAGYNPDNPLEDSYNQHEKAKTTSSLDLKEKPDYTTHPKFQN